MGNALRYIPLTVLAVLFATPFMWMVSTSLTPEDQILDIRRPFVPPKPAWGNYYDALTVLPFVTFLKNTLTIALLCTIGQTLSASLVAFAFARMNFPFKNALFMLVLATMMIPAQVTMIPQFIMFTFPRWIDTLRPLIVPAFFGGGAFFIFLLRQFFMTIPKELEEAARIDGCNTLRVYWHVIMPNSKPALITVALFSFIGHWNDFLGPLIYLQNQDKKTLALGLAAFKSLHGTDYHLLMAASVSVLVPIIVIFFVAQRYFTQGVVMSGVKG